MKRRIQKTIDFRGQIRLSDEEEEQVVREVDEYGNVLVYPAWSKKNAPKDGKNKWEVPIYV